MKKKTLSQKTIETTETETLSIYRLYLKDCNTTRYKFWHPRPL